MCGCFRQFPKESRLSRCSCDMVENILDSSELFVRDSPNNNSGSGWLVPLPLQLIDQDLGKGDLSFADSSLFANNDEGGP